jgi:FAD/FMN-containing dehydrogenase
MKEPGKFVSIIRSEFPDDRVTYQKRVPTFHPESAAEAAKLFKLANRHGQKMYITGFGNNIDPVGEPFVDMVSIRTDRLNALLEVVPQDFFVTAGSGYPLREVNLQLERIKLSLPHSSLAYVGSVGGAIATGLNVELDGQDLPLKKYFIKAEIVTPEGDIIRPGSACFKSVSGYDIVKVFYNSWGLLGLIVSATFRVMPTATAAELGPMKMKAINREDFLAGLAEANTAADAVYSRKVKAKFDPRGILPIV